MILFERQIFKYFHNMRVLNAAQPLNLGGTAASGGGGGGPPGGFVGMLPQTRVAFDKSELEDNSYPSPVYSGSILHNLNRIRYRIAALEDAIPVYGSFYTNDAIAVTLTNQNDWYELDAAQAWTAGPLSGCTFTDPYLVAGGSGAYKINWALSGRVDSANQGISGGIMIDQSTVQNQGQARIYYLNSTRNLTVASTAIVSLTANQKVSLAVRNITSGGKIYTVQKGNITIQLLT